MKSMCVEPILILILGPGRTHVISTDMAQKWKKKMAGKIPLPVVQKTRENPEHDADSYGGQCFHEIVTKFLLLT